MASDPWVLALDANHASAGERAVFTRLAPTLRGSECRILVETCHRAELYGFGDLPGHFACLGSTRILVAEMAVRHLMRVAAGLESVVVGEEQVLHQVRMALAARPPSVPLELTRLFETAISCGRRARAARARKSLDLATIAVRWLAQRRRLRDRRVLVVGAGRMGTAIASALHLEEAQITVGSRSLIHALATASRFGGSSVDLAEAARLAPRCCAIAVALGGPWDDLARIDTALPPTADLSSPAAVTRRAGVVDLLTIDDVHLLRLDDQEYASLARAHVDAAAEGYLRWLDGRRRSAWPLRRKALPTLAI
jgi:glutamyl-tRNA reductase